MCCIELWHHVLFYITYTSTRSLTPHTATVYTLVAYNTAPPIHPPLYSLAERAGEGGGGGGRGGRGDTSVMQSCYCKFYETNKDFVDGLGKCSPKYTMLCKKPHSVRLKLIVMLSKHL